MGFLLSNIPWMKVGAAALAVSLIIFGIWGIKKYGEQSQILIQQRGQAEIQHTEDEAALRALKTQYELDLKSIQKEKDDALHIATDAQQQLEKIKYAPQSGDGAIRPVLADTLNWMRGKSSGRNPSPQSPPSR